MNRRLLHTRDRGAVLPIVALLLPVLMVMTAFAVDLGRQRSSRRDMQAIADVVSLDLSRLADGRTVAEIQAGGSGQPAAEAALVASASRNGIDRAQLALDWGTWDEATGYLSWNGVSTFVPNAAKVVATEDTDYFFQSGSGSATREAIARYGAEPLAGFSVGSFGLAMSTADAKLLDDVLSPFIDDDPLTSDPVSLDALSYQGLAGADVPLGDFMGSFGAVTPHELLETQVSLHDFMLAAAEVLRNQDPPKAAEAQLVEDSVTARMREVMVDIGGLVGAESGAEDAAMAADVDIPTVISGAVFQSRCETTPLGFEECEAISVPALTTTLPLLSSTSSLKVIQSPRFHYGPIGTGVDTGQVQASIDAVVGAQHVGDCTPTLSNLLCTLNGLLVNTVDARVTIDATLTLAGGHTSITDIDCADPAALGLALRSATDLYDVDLAVKVEFGTRGLLGGLLGQVFGTMDLVGATTTTDASDDVTFTVAPDVLGQTTKTTGAGSVGLAPVALQPVGSVTGVINDLAYLGISYSLGSVVSTLVNPVLAEMDARVLGPLTNQLGLNISGSDLVAQAIDCKPGFVELVH